MELLAREGTRVHIIGLSIEKRSRFSMRLVAIRSRYKEAVENIRRGSVRPKGPTVCRTVFMMG
jgi:hypothetical protein